MIWNNHYNKHDLFINTLSKKVLASAIMWFWPLSKFLFRISRYMLVPCFTLVSQFEVFFLLSFINSLGFWSRLKLLIFVIINKYSTKKIGYRKLFSRALMIFDEARSWVKLTFFHTFYALQHIKSWFVEVFYAGIPLIIIFNLVYIIDKSSVCENKSENNLEIFYTL